MWGHARTHTHAHPESAGPRDTHWNAAQFDDLGDPHQLGVALLKNTRTRTHAHARTHTLLHEGRGPVNQCLVFALTSLSFEYVRTLCVCSVCVCVCVCVCGERCANDMEQAAPDPCLRVRGVSTLTRG